nr:tripartite tricarboxylate transporter substrate-binding protein [Roseococcus sp. MDT2-1-1]
MLGAGATLAALGPAMAQESYPNRPVVLVTGYPPGGHTDITTRALAEHMARSLGQPVVVENKPGAATAIAAQQAVQARPDGYQLLMGTASLAINPALQPGTPPQDPRRELLPVGMAYRTSFVLHVHADLPVRSLPEFLAFAKERPGRLNYGSGGNGAVNHLAFALLCQQTGLDMVHVPYRGDPPATLDLQAGRVQAIFQSPVAAAPSVAAGKTRALAVSSRDRLRGWPELPAVAELLPGYEAVFWQGLFAPIGTPEPVTAKLAAALRAATDDAELREAMERRGVTLVSGDADYLQRLLAEDTERWGGLIRSAGIRAE